MQVQSLYSNNRNKYIGFGSGLTKEILQKEASIKPSQIERYFRNLSTKDWRSFSSYDTDFKDNNAVALANYLCSKVFIKFRKIADYRHDWSLQNLTSPQGIYVFNENDSELYKNHGMFTSNSDLFFEKDKPMFYSGTVFINNKLKSLEYINECCDEQFYNKEISSTHFLQPFIHEWIHAIETKLLNNISFNFCGYNHILQKFHIPQLNSKENEIVADIVGSYAAKPRCGQYYEVLAESWSKFICDALSEDCTNFVKNPVDLMKQTPIEFQNILKKVTDIKTINQIKTSL